MDFWATFDFNFFSYIFQKVFARKFVFFFFFSVCFETDLIVLVVSKRFRNTETKKIDFGFAKQTATQLKQIEFRLVLVRTKIFFCF
jgi:hypothetical protein